MNIVLQIVDILIKTFTFFSLEIGKAFFIVKDAIDSVKETIIAAGLGVPVIVVSIGSVVISIGCFIIRKVF